MPSLQIRDMPEEIYNALAQRAQRQRRSLAEQAIADLARIPEMESHPTRHEVIEQLRKSGPVLPKNALDPVTIIREDRDR